MNGRGARGVDRPSRRPRLITFFGSNGKGYVTESSLRIGDEITSVLDISSVPAPAETSFETFVTQEGKLYQTSSSNLSTHPFFAVVVEA